MQNFRYFARKAPAATLFVWWSIVLYQRGGTVAVYPKDFV